MNVKTLENQLRRTLAKQGLALRKSRYRNPDLLRHYGGYMIIDALRNTIEAGEHYTLNLEEVEEYVSV